MSVIVDKYYPVLSARLAQVLAAIRGRKIAVVGHARPDGDCIGSQVALARVLHTLGIDAICVNPDPVPRRLQFLTGGMTFRRTDAGTIADRLAAKNVVVDHRGDRLRFGFGMYHDATDVEALLTHL